MSQCSHAGYRFSSSLHQLPILQYTNDTCLTTSSKANCQARLNITQKWLDWSLLQAKVPKCAAISICGQTDQCTNPHLFISNERIPFLGSNSISFLGHPVNTALSTYHIKDQTDETGEIPPFSRPIPTLTPTEAEDLQGCNPSSPVMAPFPH